jgi:hypothetical protein
MRKRSFPDNLTDYCSINPIYGMLADFKGFLRIVSIPISRT